MPKNGSRIGLIKNFEGKTNDVVIKLANTKPETVAYWYVGGAFLQQTQNFHKTGLFLSEGKHKITAFNAFGNEVYDTITIE